MHFHFVNYRYLTGFFPASIPNSEVQSLIEYNLVNHRSCEPCHVQHFKGKPCLIFQEPLPMLLASCDKNTLLFAHIACADSIEDVMQATENAFEQNDAWTHLLIIDLQEEFYRFDGALEESGMTAQFQITPGTYRIDWRTHKNAREEIAFIRMRMNVNS
jgi:hypothetical protein